MSPFAQILSVQCLIDSNIRKGYENRATVNGSPENKRTWFDIRLGVDAEGLGKAGDKFHEVVAGATG